MLAHTEAGRSAQVRYRFLCNGNLSISTVNTARYFASYSWPQTKGELQK